jgi:predicted PurR-regulated permease PerM
VGELVSPSERAQGRADALSSLGRAAWSVVGIGVAAAAGFWLIGRLMAIVIPVVVALMLASLLFPLVRALQARGIPSLVAVWTALLGLLGVLFGAAAWLVPVVSGETGAFRTSVGSGVDRVESWLVTGPLHLDQARVAAWGDSLRAQFGSFESDVAKGALARTPWAFEVVGGTVLAAVLLFYLLRLAADPPRPPWISPAVRYYAAAMWDTLGGFTRGLVVNAFVNALVLGIAVFVLGVPLAAPIAAVTFLASFVPIVGAIVSGALAALVALVAVGPVAALIVVAVTVAIHHLEAYVVGPLIIGHRTGLHPVALIVAVAIGLKLAGVAGAFLAGPMMAAGSGWLTSTRSQVDE